MMKFSTEWKMFQLPNQIYNPGFASFLAFLIGYNGSIDQPSNPTSGYGSSKLGSECVDAT